MSHFMLGGSQGSIGGNDSYTKVLLHMDGTNLSTTVPDTNAGGSAKTWSCASTGLYTAFSKFGPSSWGSPVIGVPGQYGYIGTGATTDFALGTGDFTIDFWFYCLNNAPTSSICGQYDSGANASNSSVAVFLNGGKLGASASNSSFFVGATGTTTVAANTWYHAAFVRDGTILRVFLNGNQEATNTFGTGAVQSASGVWSLGYIGVYTGAGVFQGYIDEFRLSKGIARWTSNFTPPTQPYS